eukprot:1139287-Pelagomonas_calceolata.AAC.1
MRREDTHTATKLTLKVHAHSVHCDLGLQGKKASKNVNAQSWQSSTLRSLLAPDELLRRLLSISSPRSGWATSSYDHVIQAMTMLSKISWAGNTSGNIRDLLKKRTKNNKKFNCTLSPLRNGPCPSSKMTGCNLPLQSMYQEELKQTRAASSAGAL